MNETSNSSCCESKHGESNCCAELKESCATLRHQLNSMLILLLLVSATMMVFFLRQTTLSRKELTNAQTVISDYNKNTVPVLQQFMRQLQEYGKTHPDVMPILNKYGVNQISNAAPPAAASKK